MQLGKKIIKFQNFRQQGHICDCWAEIKPKFINFLINWRTEADLEKQRRGGTARPVGLKPKSRRPRRNHAGAPTP